MWLGLYLVGMLASAAKFSYSRGREGKGSDDTIPAAFLVALLWLPALFTYWPWLAGRRRHELDRDASVQASIRASEMARLEEDCRQEVARALVGHVTEHGDQCICPSCDQNPARTGR